MKKIIYIFVFIFLSSLISCKESYNSDIPTIFYLPVWPPADSWKDYYPAVEQWNISVNTSEASYSFSLSSTAKCFPLQISDSVPVSVTAAPLTSGIHFFKPAGTIYPFSNQLTWKNGVSATLLKKIYIASKNQLNLDDFALQFNWQKMIDSINQKSTESKNFYNPWHLEQPVILEKIMCGKFSATCLNVKNIKVCEINDFKEFSEGIFLSSYIPQNFSASINGLFSVKINTEEGFLLCEKKHRLAIANISDNSDFFSLTFYDLPIK